MTRVLIPTVLREKCGGNPSVSVKGTNVQEALADLSQQYPDVLPQLFDPDGRLLNFVNVFVGDENIRDLNDESTKVAAGDEILIVPALAGG